jgi:Protein of unknown function (DUF2934)
MPLRAGNNDLLEPRANTAQPLADQISCRPGPTAEEISRLAYEIYLERGGEPGHDLDDWLQAERELEMASFFFL